MSLLFKFLADLITSLFREAFAWRQQNPDSATTSVPTPSDEARQSRLLSTLPHHQPPQTNPQPKDPPP